MASDNKDEAAVGAEDLFECRMCGDCCKGFGGTIVAFRDVERIAAFVGVTPEHFVEAYCRPSGSRKVLAQGKDGYCIFYNDRCTIHAVKPAMCRAWPFIPAVLVDVANWHSMAASCPGMRTDLPDDVIQRCVARILDESAKKT